MKKISKRDILFFFLGIFAFFLFEFIYDWDETKRVFQNGYENNKNSSQKVTTIK